MSRINAALQSARPPFLLLTLSCVTLGVCSVIAAGGQVHPVDLLLVVIGALAAHIAVNALNEYVDFRSGLDLHTVRTPFSGGSGSLPAMPAAQSLVLQMALACVAICIAVGLYFTIRLGPVLLPVGLLGLALVLCYTPWINRSVLLCLVAPGLGFGPAMVLGTHIALGGMPGWQVLFYSLFPFFLASNLLLLNQFPDTEADRNAGRRHLPIACGLRCATHVYGSFVLACFALLGVGLALGWLNRWSLLTALPLTAGLAAYVGALRFAGQVPRLIPFMGLNVINTLLSPVVLGLSIALA